MCWFALKPLSNIFLLISIAMLVLNVLAYVMCTAVILTMFGSVALNAIIRQKDTGSWRNLLHI